MKRVLIACSPGQMAAQLQKRLRSHFPNDIEVHQAADQSEAKDILLSGSYDLLIAHADLSYDENSPIVTGDYLGVQLFTWMNEQELDTPGIVVAPVWEPKLTDAFGGLAKVSLVLQGADFDQKLLDAADRYLRNKLAPQFLKVRIFADGDRDWRWELEGEGFTYQEKGSLVIDESSIRQLEHQSVVLDKEEGPLWPEHLKFLGLQLNDRIFQSNIKLREGLERGWVHLDTRDGNTKLGKTKICFHVVKPVHPIFFEAVVSDDVANEFWMLNASIYRRVDNYRSTRSALFPCSGRPQTIN